MTKSNPVLTPEGGENMASVAESALALHGANTGAEPAGQVKP